MATDRRHDSSRLPARHPRSSVSTLLALAIALPFISCILAAGLAVAQQHRQDRNTAQLTRTFEVRRVTQDVLTQLLDLESSQRGYVLTAKGEYLESFERARRGVPDALRRLTSLVGTAPDQAARVADLSQVAGARVALAAEIVAAVGRGRIDSARALVESGRGRQLTDEARTLVTAMDDDEDRRLLAGQTALTASSAAQARNLSALVATSAVALAVLILLVRRMLAYEDVVKMCAWSRTIEYQGEWMSFEQYLGARFGIVPSHGVSPDAARRVREESRTARPQAS